MLVDKCLHLWGKCFRNSWEFYKYRFWAAISKGHICNQKEQQQENNGNWFLCRIGFLPYPCFSVGNCHSKWHKVGLHTAQLLYLLTILIIRNLLWQCILYLVHPSSLLSPSSFILLNPWSLHWYRLIQEGMVCGDDPFLVGI